jgi:hypothetical protein
MGLVTTCKVGVDFEMVRILFQSLSSLLGILGEGREAKGCDRQAQSEPAGQDAKTIRRKVHKYLR